MSKCIAETVMSIKPGEYTRKTPSNLKPFLLSILAANVLTVSSAQAAIDDFVATSDMVLIESTDDPLNNGGTYIIASNEDLTTSSSPELMILRNYNQLIDDIGITEQHTFSFDLRIDSPVDQWSNFDGVFIFNDSRQTPSLGNTNGFEIRAIVDNGVPQWFWRNGRRGQRSGMSIQTGAVYSFTINLDPAARSYEVRIDDGFNAVTSGSLSYRTTSSNPIANLAFGSTDRTAGDTVDVSVDNIVGLDDGVVNPDPDPTPTPIFDPEIDLVETFSGVKATLDLDQVAISEPVFQVLSVRFQNPNTPACSNGFSIAENAIGFEGLTIEACTVNQLTTLDIPVTVTAELDSGDVVEANSTWPVDVRPLSGEPSIIISKQFSEGVINRLNDDLGATMNHIFDQFAEQSVGADLSGATLYKQLWEAQSTSPAVSTGEVCHAPRQTIDDVSTFVLNGFPFDCDREEVLLVSSNNESNIDAEMASYELVGITNRIDAAGQNWMHCGEHRLTYSKDASGENIRRNLLIFEAQMANPTPGDIQGCSDIIDFWAGLSSLANDAAIASALNDFFFEGISGRNAVISIENFVEGSGQIRTNQFWGDNARAPDESWVLREYKLLEPCLGGNAPCDLQARLNPVKANPFGELFDAEISQDAISDFSARAGLFQQDFIDNVGSLLNNEFLSLGLGTLNSFNNGQSHSNNLSNNNVKRENEYFDIFNDSDPGQTSPFATQLLEAIGDSLDASGQPLGIEQVLNRATAMTCAGCHEPSRFGLLVPGAVGAMLAPDGSIMNSWPDTRRDLGDRNSGFMHIDHDGTLSEALIQFFIPGRLSMFQGVLEERFEN